MRSLTTFSAVVGLIASMMFANVESVPVDSTGNGITAEETQLIGPPPAVEADGTSVGGRTAEPTLSY